MSAEKQRLTIEVWQWATATWPRHWQWKSRVRLGESPVASFETDTEPEARAAAEGYVSELLAHFRKGGT